MSSRSVKRSTTILAREVALFLSFLSVQRDRVFRSVTLIYYNSTLTRAIREFKMQVAISYGIDQTLHNEKMENLTRVKILLLGLFLAFNLG